MFRIIHFAPFKSHTDELFKNNLSLKFNGIIENLKRNKLLKELTNLFAPMKLFIDTDEM